MSGEGSGWGAAGYGTYIAGTPVDETAAPLVFVGADGPHLLTADGRRILDWASALNAPFGHSVRLPTQDMPVNVGNYRTPQRDAVVDRLATLFPHLSGFQLRSSGTESVEAALRYVRGAFTEAVHTVSIEGCYHGLSLGAQQLMGTVSTNNHTVLSWSDVVAVERARDTLARLIAAGPVAVWLEGIQGGTLRRLPAAFGSMLEDVRQLHPGRVVVVVDDMLASVRCGSWSSVDALVRPDLLIGGKSWSCGYPFSFFGIASWIRAAAGDLLGTTTFGGNPVACAYAAHTIDRITNDDTFAHIQSLQEHFAPTFLQSGGAVSRAWHGLLFGLTASSKAVAVRIAAEAAAQGLLVAQLGPVIRCSPTLDATVDQMEFGLRCLSSAVDVVCS